MRNASAPVVILTLLAWACAGQENKTNDPGETAAGKVVATSEGLHGYSASLL